jgi:hypothetical protein
VVLFADLAAVLPGNADGVFAFLGEAGSRAESFSSSRECSCLSRSTLVAIRRLKNATASPTASEAPSKKTKVRVAAARSFK